MTRHKQITCKSIIGPAAEAPIKCVQEHLLYNIFVDYIINLHDYYSIFYSSFTKLLQFYAAGCWML
jgi:hypothetical protein